MIVINFKSHKTGKKALQLERVCSRFKKVIIALQPQDIKQITSKTRITAYSEYINKKVNAKFIKKSGAKGTLLNHSNYPITNKTLKKRIKECKKIKIKTIVCCTTTKRAKQIDKLKPDYIAIEPKELIGGKISVSTAKPRLISNTIKAVKTPVLCGAGINKQKDVSQAVRLGAKGILVSSAIVKSQKPERKLKELTAGLK